MPAKTDKNFLEGIEKDRTANEAALNEALNAREKEVAKGSFGKVVLIGFIAFFAISTCIAAATTLF